MRGLLWGRRNVHGRSFLLGEEEAMEEKTKEFDDLDWEEKKLVWRIRGLADMLDHDLKYGPELYPETPTGIAGILEDIAERLQQYLLAGK
jgi:hypothetical protein